MEKFDPARGIKLNTFAYLRIRGAMIDELRKRDWFPRSARTKAKKLEEVIRKLEARLGRYPREEEVAEELKVDLDDYLIMLKDFGSLSVLSIEDISEVSGMDREGIIRYVVEEGASPEARAEMRELEGLLGREIDRLPEKQKLVLSLYYYEDMNMKEIAEVLGITEARISQIHSQAVLSLRTFLKKKLK
jgi:RNA polymerase sigma factor for flagellar operon FliA